MLADQALDQLQDELLLHLTCGVRAVTFRPAPWSGEEEPYCVECELWIHPLYLREVTGKELF